MRASLAATTLAFAVLTLSSGSHAASGLRPKYGPWGVDYATMDRAVKPGDDFFRYAEGSWLKTAAIQPDKVGAGYNYDLPDQAEIDVREIVEDAQAHGLKFDPSYVYTVRGYDKATASKKAPASKKTPSSKPAVTTPAAPASPPTKFRWSSVLFRLWR